jgi:hypothetical protein
VFGSSLQEAGFLPGMIALRAGKWNFLAIGRWDSEESAFDQPSISIWCAVIEVP